jgi:hypothetical protein
MKKLTGRQTIRSTSSKSIYIVSLLLLFFMTASLAQGQVVPSTASALAANAHFNAHLAGANNGSIQSQLAVADDYLHARGTTRNPAESVRWLTAASQQGSAEATARLGLSYLFGHGVPKDISYGARLIQQAADAHDRWDRDSWACSTRVERASHAISTRRSRCSLRRPTQTTAKLISIWASSIN